MKKRSFFGSTLLLAFRCVLPAPRCGSDRDGYPDRKLVSPTPSGVYPSSITPAAG